MKLKGLDKILLMSANAKQASATSRVDAHVAGTAEKHAAEKVTYSGSVVGATDVKQGIDLLKARVDEIITTPISGEAAAQELVDARGQHVTLGNRLDEADLEIENINTEIDNIPSQTYITEKATKVYVDSLAGSIASGAPKGVYATIAALQSAFPAGTTGIYLVAADGNWYYWSGSAWASGGVYQSQIASASEVSLTDSDKLFNAANSEDAFKEILVNLYDNTYRVSGMTSLLFTYKKDYYASSAGWVSNAGYDSYYFIASKEFQTYVVDASLTYLSISLYSNGVVNSTNFKVRLRASEANLPTAQAMLSVLENDVIVVTVLASDPGFAIYTNYEQYLNGNIRLSSAQMAQVANKKMSIIYETGTYDQGATERLCVYVPTVQGYIKYVINHCVDVAKNADSWHVRGAYLASDNYTELSALTTEGEWEAAVRLNSRSDYSGGFAHGDEVFSNLTIFVDGKITETSEITAMTSADHIRITETSEMYDPADGVTVISEHGREYIFADNCLVINQVMIWKVAAALIDSYMAMFPAAKTTTKTYFTDMDFLPTTIPASPNITVANAKKATVYSDDVGFLADFEIAEYPTGLTGGDVFSLRDNGGGDYHKLYFFVCSSGYTSSINEVWKTKTIYKLSYNS